MESEEGEVSRRNILFFPNEILSKIFSFVATEDLLLNVSRVSKKFHEIVENPHAHVRVTLPDTINGEDSGLINFLSKNDLIEELHLTKGEGCIRHFNDDILNSIDVQKRLKIFSLESRHLVLMDQLVRCQFILNLF